MEVAASVDKSKQEILPFAQVEEKFDEETNCWKVLVRFNGAPKNDIDVQDYLKKIDFVYQRDKPFAILYDASKITIPSTSAIEQQVTFMRQKDSATRKLVRCCAIVAPSAILVKILQAMFLLKKPACKLQIFKTMKEAKDFLKSQ